MIKKKEEKQVTCYECGKSKHYKIDSPSMVKCKGKQMFYKTKGKNPNGHKAYIAWEKDEEY